MSVSVLYRRNRSAKIGLLAFHGHFRPARLSIQIAACYGEAAYFYATQATGFPATALEARAVAWNLAIRAEELRAELTSGGRRFHSLRRAARIFGVSTQPVRDWIRFRYLRPDGPRRQISTTEMVRFVDWVEARATPFEAEHYLKRIFGKDGRTFPFHKLRSARLVWPRGRLALTPTELSARIGCHPSLILKVMCASELRGRLRTPERWEIRRRDWTHAFPGTLISSRDCPPMPNGGRLSIGDVARYLRKCGIGIADSKYVRQLLEDRYLEEKRGGQQGKTSVTKRSLRKYIRSLNKDLDM